MKKSVKSKKRVDLINKIISDIISHEKFENNIKRNSPEYEIQKKLSENELNEKRVQTLRRIFKNRLKNIRPSDHLFWKLPEDMCEAAHIFPVSEIKKQCPRSAQSPTAQ